MLKVPLCCGIEGILHIADILCIIKRIVCATSARTGDDVQRDGVVDKLARGDVNIVDANDGTRLDVPEFCFVGLLAIDVGSHLLTEPGDTSSSTIDVEPRDHDAIDDVEAISR